jgi:hypothetical protein
VILGLCDRFHCLPDAARQMDASVLRMVAIEGYWRQLTRSGGEGDG